MRHAASMVVPRLHGVAVTFDHAMSPSRTWAGQQAGAHAFAGLRHGDVMACRRYPSRRHDQSVELGQEMAGVTRSSRRDELFGSTGSMNHRLVGVAA